MAVRGRSARRIALETLYEHDVAGAATGEILSRYQGQKALPYAEKLVAGVAEHQVAIDDLIEACAEDWTLARMPPVDRNLLRLGVLELRYLAVIPAVAIDEAVSLAAAYSTADSGRFINGILGRIAREGAPVGEP
ncbi:MAG TPA: transcription antitermination factor NusB [Actinomycetota bacterium]|nr:transcription antitermination factor NusB [Actinomycetota bacterium]